MKQKIGVVLIILIILITCFSSQSIISVERLDFDSYIDQLNDQYDDDREKILSTLNSEIDNKNNSTDVIGLNMVVREYFFYIWGESEKFIENADKTEQYLSKNKMDYELLQLYSLLTSKYTGMEHYSNAYIYLDKGERIARKIYENDKNQKNLSTLVAIKYLKSVVALDINMEDIAEKTFNEAEELRKEELQDIERVDIYMNILIYYEYKKEYDLVEEYAYKCIELIKKIDPDHEIYYTRYIRTNIMLANSYLNKKEIDKCIAIINELQKDEKIFKYRDFIYEMNHLYAHVYKYYGNYEEYLNYLKKAYDIMKDTKSYISTFHIVESIIDELEIQNNTSELLEWYKIERVLVKDVNSFLDTQYLLTQIIDTDLQNANYDIENLNLQKSNMIFLIEILVLITAIIVILILLERKRKKLLKENIYILEKNMEIQHRYYEDLISHKENIKRINHDIKNHIAVITQLIAKEEFGYVNNYLVKIKEKMEQNERKIISNNKVIDAIIIDKISKCKSKGITLDLDIKIPEKVSIDDFDLCVIYGNLLDNAIEACEKITEEGKEKYIKLKSMIKGEYLFINIKNSYNSEITIKENKFITTKKDKINHGIGLSSIKKSVKNNDGDIKMDYTKDEFNVSIILTMKTQ